MGATEAKVNIKSGAFMKMGAEEQNLTKVENSVELEDLHKKFEEKEGRPVPNNKKNDLEWILSKINS